MIDTMKELEFQNEHIIGATLKIELIFQEIKQGRMTQESAKRQIACLSHRICSYACSMTREAVSDSDKEATDDNKEEA